MYQEDFKQYVPFQAHPGGGAFTFPAHYWLLAPYMNVPRKPNMTLFWSNARLDVDRGGVMHCPSFLDE
ncbi:MAG: hypothetical protein JKX85_05930 [Phycisphaeraceae bacterium]|nr:hypothetical protein [Phycisphaeraceae bacterium]